MPSFICELSAGLFEYLIGIQKAVICIFVKLYVEIYINTWWETQKPSSEFVSSLFLSIAASQLIPWQLCLRTILFEAQVLREAICSSQSKRSLTVKFGHGTDLRTDRVREELDYQNTLHLRRKKKSCPPRSTCKTWSSILAVPVACLRTKVWVLMSSTWSSWVIPTSRIPCSKKYMSNNQCNRNNKCYNWSIGSATDGHVGLFRSYTSKLETLIYSK